MKKSIYLLTFFLVCFVKNLNAVSNFAEIYPPINQQVIGTILFDGDRHGEFAGDYASVLSDGSIWKVHPNHRELYERWSVGDNVRIMVRTTHYWFKREHKFAMYNYNLKQEIHVMLVHHSDFPITRQIINTEKYAHSYTYVTKYRTEYYWVNGELKNRFVAYQEAVPVYRKVIMLSDGSYWVIKDNLNDFTIGSEVYVGAQGEPNKWYDFILITGAEREAIWTYARPPK